jgi:ADP-ribose pyrophosphatase
MEENYVFKGKKFSVKVEDCILPSGAKATFEIVEYIGATVILPLLNKDTVLLLKQYRPSIRKWIYEIPAGTLEPNEDPYKCAARELEEETGYRAGSLLKMFEMYTAPGYSTEKLYSFLALNLQPSICHLDQDEELIVTKISLDKALKMIKMNEICDAKTISTILYYTKFGDKFRSCAI